MRRHLLLLLVLFCSANSFAQNQNFYVTPTIFDRPHYIGEEDTVAYYDVESNGCPFYYTGRNDYLTPFRYEITIGGPNLYRIYIYYTPKDTVAVSYITDFEFT